MKAAGAPFGAAGAPLRAAGAVLEAGGAEPRRAWAHFNLFLSCTDFSMLLVTPG